MKSSFDQLPLGVGFDRLFIERLFDLVSIDPGSRTTSRVASVFLLTVGVWLLHSFVNLLVGYPQKQEGRGTWRRLALVSAVVGVMQVLPVGVGLILLAGEYTWVNVRSLSIALPILWLFGACVLTTAMAPLHRLLRAAKQSLIVQDAHLVQRVAELSSRMSLSAPVVRIWRSGGSGELQAMAFVGGLAAPVLLIADGVLHRLTEEERDSIIGHELAHLTNGSLWYLLSAIPLSIFVALLAATLTTPVFGLMVGIAVYFLTQRPISRYLEYDCDRRSAEVLGFRSMVNALSKIHAAHPVRNHGWLSYIVYATATHPSRVERLAALRDGAPRDDQPKQSWEQREVRRRKLASKIAMACGCLMFLTGLFWHRLDPQSVVPAILLGLVVMTPVSAMLFAFRKSTSRVRRRRPSTWVSPLRWTAMSCLLSFVVFIQQMRSRPLDGQNSEPSGLAILFFLIGIVSLCAICILILSDVFGRRSRLRKKCGVLMQTHQFAEVVTLAERFPKTIAKDPLLCYALALSRALSGDRARAVGELFWLIDDVPKMYDGAVLLALLAIDDGHPERALPLCDRLIAALPDDPDPLTIRATALCSLDRLDEAEATVRLALDVDPDAGYAYAVQAAIEWKRGNREAGEVAFQNSEEHVPGTAFLHYVRAQYAICTADIEEAKSEVLKAIKACNANPFAILQKRMQRLAEQVGLDTGDEQ